MSPMLAISQSARREGQWLRHVALIFVGLLGAIGFGEELESYFAPVLKDISSKSSRLTPDGRLCFQLSFTKRRAALPVSAYAELYDDTNFYPAFVGLEHMDGTPYGPAYALPPSTRAVVTCAHVPSTMRNSPRIGLRMHFEYRTVHGFWTVRQAPIWVDWYARVSPP